MKALAGVLVLSLAVPSIAQRVTLPATPAQPQPGIATGASGGIGTPAYSVPAPGVSGGLSTAPGPRDFRPPPVLMTPDQLRPEYPDPFALERELFPLLFDLEPPPQPVTAQGRPGGLGVTITGGSTNPPPVVITPPATNAVGTLTNITPAITNAPAPPINGNVPY